MEFFDGNGVERSAEKLIIEMGGQHSAQRLHLAEGHSAAPLFFSIFLSPWAFQVILQNKILGSGRCLHCVCAQSCPTLCNPMDYSPPGSSVHGISQAGILERGAIISLSRGSSRLRDQPVSPALAGGLYQLSHQRESLTVLVPYPRF